jgi:hypothetical protein
MASKLFRKIQPATPINNVGRLRYFDRSYGDKDLNVYALDFGSNRKWRRIESNLFKQVSSLELPELLDLVATKDCELVKNDYFHLVEIRGQAHALKQLKLYLIENHLTKELIKFAVDFSIPEPKTIRLSITSLFRAYKLREAKTAFRIKKLRVRSCTFSSITPVLHLTQQSPNAPNTSPAFSLAAA